MQGISLFFRSDNYLLVMSLLMVVLIIAFVVLLISNFKLKNKYEKFMKKMGNGQNLEEDLGNFMYKVDRVEKQNAEILGLCKALENDLSRCLNKVGIVRYNAFKDTGSDLSFAVALLDDENSGVVFNGIYSRDMSNIYAKPVERGNSQYAFSDEESEAIRRAIDSSNVYREK